MKIEIITFFKCAATFFLAIMKAQRDDGVGRILLGDNTGGGALVMRPIRFQCDGVRIQTGSPCIYVPDLRRTFRYVTLA